MTADIPQAAQSAQTTQAARDAPVSILVEPQLGENVGAAARAMLNFGLTEMRV